MYPEHEKLEKIKDQSQAIGEFLESMEMKGIELAKWKSPFEGAPKRLVPLYESKQTILAEYFDIDQQKLEREKQQMLNSLGENQK